MEENKRELEKEEKIIVEKNEQSKSNLVFLKKKFIIDSNNKSDKDKICPYCGKSLFSKFSKNRHINIVHLKSNLNSGIVANTNIDDPNRVIKGNELKTENGGKKEKKITFIGAKHYMKSKENNEIIENNDIEGQAENRINDNKNKEKSEGKNIDGDKISELNLKYEQGSKENNSLVQYNLEKKTFQNLLVEEKSNELFINQNKEDENSSESDIIKKNFYNILKSNDYLSIGPYFLFKNFVIGKGKFGTVYFGINIKNAKPIAIKENNEDKRKQSFEVEEFIMQKLKKFKIFSTILDKLVFNNKVYLIETLQYPNLEKFKTFCGGKFSMATTYKIGIDILKCLQLIHRIGYIYLDLKSDNVVLLNSPKKFEKNVNKITLIDYGFCEKYSKAEENAPKVHGNKLFASINSLSGNPVSRKDDIISFCYFLVYLYFGSLPWESKKNCNIGMEEIINLKTIYSPKKLCSNATKEILFIFNDANSLEFAETPRYTNYMELLKNAIKAKTGKDPDDIKFDWDNNLSKIIQKNNGIENLIKEDEKIMDLFEGYPEIVVNLFLKKYLN